MFDSMRVQEFLYRKVEDRHRILRADRSRRAYSSARESLEQRDRTRQPRPAELVKEHKSDDPTSPSPGYSGQRDQRGWRSLNRKRSHRGDPLHYRYGNFFGMFQRILQLSFEVCSE